MQPVADTSSGVDARFGQISISAEPAAGVSRFVSVFFGQETKRTENGCLTRRLLAYHQNYEERD